MDKTDLLPCPFCGSPASFTDDDSYGSCHVSCSGGCAAEPCTSARKDQPEKAIAAWNTRTPDPRITHLEAEMRRIAEGNLGDAPWQANYDRIREIARASLSSSGEG